MKKTRRVFEHCSQFVPNYKAMSKKNKINLYKMKRENFVFDEEFGQQSLKIRSPMSRFRRGPANVLIYNFVRYKIYTKNFMM